MKTAAVWGCATWLVLMSHAASAQTNGPFTGPGFFLPPPKAEGQSKSLWPEAGAPVTSLKDIPVNPRPIVPRSAALSGYSEVPFSEKELIAGKRMTEAECAAQPSAVWVVVGKIGECVAYYHSVPAAVATSNAPPSHVTSPNATSPAATSVTATNHSATADSEASDAGTARSAVVFLSDDLVSVNGRGEVKPFPLYGKVAPAMMQNESITWSGRLRMPYLTLARPGTFGSSGNHAERRSEREIAVVSAALDAIKTRHKYDRLHLAAYAEGAHTAAMLLTRRDDLGCVVLSSGLLSVKQYLTDLGRTTDWTGNKTPLDPAGTRDRIVQQPALRILVLTDPDDLVISARSQTAYVRRMNGLPVQQIFSAAPDAAGHVLLNLARQVAGDCANGAPDAQIRQKYENKVPAEAPDASDPPLHRPDTLRREVVVGEAQCATIKTALWLTVDRRKLCIRYWVSSAGGTRAEPLIFFDGDLGSNEGDRLALNAGAARVTGGQMQRMAGLWSRTYGGTYVQLARVGTFGSSGFHTQDRATSFEVRVAMAAIDALKVKYGWTRLHVAGHSGGGHTVAALARERDDIGCAAMASGGIALKLAYSYRGAVIGDNLRAKYDPYDHVTDKAYPSHLRMIVVSDPGDRIVSYSSQAAFVTLARLQNVPVVHLLTDAADKDHHGVSVTGIKAAADCAKGVSDRELAKTYHNTTARAARF